MFPILIMLFIFSIGGIIFSMEKGKVDKGLLILFSAMLVVTAVTTYTLVQDLINKGIPLI